MAENEQRISWSFGELEANLAVLHYISSSKRTAFQARLKHLHRLGFPRGFRASQGKASRYHVGAVFQMAFALELIQCGFPPEKAIELIDQRWWVLMPALKDAAQRILRVIDKKVAVKSVNVAHVVTDQGDIILAVTPMALSYLTTDIDHPAFDVSAVSFREIGNDTELVGEQRRLLLVNLSDLVRHLASFPLYGEPAQISYQRRFLNELVDWLSRIFKEPGALDHRYLHEMLREFEWTNCTQEAIDGLIETIASKLNELNRSRLTLDDIKKYMLDFGYLKPQDGSK